MSNALDATRADVSNALDATRADVSNALGALRGRRVAFLTATDGPGGAEHVLGYLAVRLREAGVGALACLPANRHGVVGARLAGTGVVTLHFDRDAEPEARVAWLADSLRRHRVDLLHTHMAPMAVDGASAARRAGLPNVTTLHGLEWGHWPWRRRRELRRALLASPAVTVVATELRRRLCRDLWLRPGRVCVIPNGTWLEPEPGPRHGERSVRSELGVPSEAALLLSVARLAPVKAHHVLLEAAARLPEPTPHVALAGAGPLREELASRARSLGIEERVHLLGLRSDVARLLAAADVFVLPSLSEGHSLSLLEAMRAGRPIVATDVGANRRTLEAGACGVLVPPGDVAALAAALERLLADPERARDLGRRAAERAAAAHGAQAMLERYAALYARLLRAGSARPA